MRKQKREEQELKCRCGHLQMSAAIVAFKCKKCGGFNYVDAALERVKGPVKFLEGLHGKLSGYCADCGMMLMGQEQNNKGACSCPKCGSFRSTKQAPRPAGNIVAVCLLGHKPHAIGRLF